MAASSEIRQLIAEVTRELRAAEKARAKIPALKKELRENVAALKRVLKDEQQRPKPRAPKAAAAPDPYREVIYEVQEQVRHGGTNRLSWERRAGFATPAEANNSALEQGAYSHGPEEKGGRVLLGVYRVREVPRTNVAKMRDDVAQASSKLEQLRKPRGFLGLW